MFPSSSYMWILKKRYFSTPINERLLHIRLIYTSSVDERKKMRVTKMSKQCPETRVKHIFASACPILWPLNWQEAKSFLKTNRMKFPLVKSLEMNNTSISNTDFSQKCWRSTKNFVFEKLSSTNLKFLNISSCSACSPSECCSIPEHSQDFDWHVSSSQMSFWGTKSPHIWHECPYSNVILAFRAVKPLHERIKQRCSETNKRNGKLSSP